MHATRGDWAQLVRFCMVGGSGWIVNLVVFSVLVASGLHYVPAAVVSFAVAWCSNFVLNRIWTFRREGPIVAQGARHLAVSLGALAINLVILQTLVSLGLVPIGAQAIAIVLVAPLSFMANRRWAFR